jgi:hypothetical protein
MAADPNGNVLERCLHHLQEKGFSESESYAICLKKNKGLRSKYPKIEKWVHKGPKEKNKVNLDNIRPGKKWHQKNKKKKKSSINIAEYVMKLNDDDPFRIAVISCIKAQNIKLHFSNIEKNAGLVNEMMIKTLKIAQKIIKGLIIKYPFKGLICYNTIKKIIIELEGPVKK